VRYDGTIHDFMLLNALSKAHATRAAIAQATAFLRHSFETDRGRRSSTALDRDTTGTSP
jgi:hypothetical protein